MNLVNYHQLIHNLNFKHFQGDQDKTNCTSGEANVVTWGVFTGSSVIQPTVVDPIAFHYWKVNITFFFYWIYNL